MSWKEDAIKNLYNSFHPVKVELNELDWKSLHVSRPRILLPAWAI